MCRSSSLIHSFVFSEMAWADGGVIVFLIFHYSVSTERGKLEDEVGCSGIVFFTQVAIS